MAQGRMRAGLAHFTGGAALHIDRPLVAASAAAPFSLTGGDRQATLFNVRFDRDGKLTPSAASDDLRDATKN